MNLYTLARTWQTLRAIAPGGPKASTRVKNIVAGRTLARAGIFQRLWGAWWR
jgi:hypothetical protein